MRPGIVDRVLYGYRIGDPEGKHLIYDDEGSQLYPGRWNTFSSPILYIAEHYSTALLEKLAHINGIFPKNQHYIEVTISNGISYEEFEPLAHRSWDTVDESYSKAYGDNWYREQRSCILIVPSIPAACIARNFFSSISVIPRRRRSHTAWPVR